MIRSLAHYTPTAYLLKRYSCSLLLPAIAAGCMWMYFQRVMIPHQEQEAAQKQKPRGNLSDLYPRWLGARELLLHGRDPYSVDVTREIQVGYYGRQLDPKLPNDPKDQQAFAYPLYVIWLLAPTVKMPFWLAQRGFFVLLTILTAGSALLWLDVLHWRMPFDRKLTWVILALFCLPAVQGLKLQQLTLLVAALIAFCMAALARGWFTSAGVILALASIKPQLVFLLVAWLCIWVTGNWRERRGFLRGYLISMLVMIAASELLLPGWIREFREAMGAYYRYTGGGGISLLDVVFTPIGGRVVAIFLVVILLALLWRMRRGGAESSEFTYSLALTLSTTLLVIPMFAPYNQILLLAPVMLLMRSPDRPLRESRLSLFVASLAKLSVLWPFFCGVLLVLGLPFLPSFIVEKAAGLPFYTTLAVPITVYATLLIGRSKWISQAHSPAEPRTLQHGAASE